MGRVSQHPTEQVSSATESPTLTSKIHFLLGGHRDPEHGCCFFLGRSRSCPGTQCPGVGLQRFNQQGHLLLQRPWGFKRIGNYFMKQFYVDCFKMFRQIISTAESPLCYCLLVVFSQINCDFPGLWYDQWFSPVPWIFFNTMLGNSWPFKNISSRQLPSLGLACGFYWLFRLSWHPHCGNPGPVLLITVRCGKSHFSHPFSPSPSRSIPHGFRAV